MQDIDQDRSSLELATSKWAGPGICVALIAVVAATENGVVSASVSQALSILLILTGVAWSVKGTDKLRRLSELYLWLAFILAMYHLQALAMALAEWTEFEALDVFRGVAIVHVLVVAVALRALGAWSSHDGSTDAQAGLERLAAGLFIIGAVVFWVGARTFTGLALDKVHTNLEGHVWTSVNFLLATLITLAGLVVFTLALREAGDRVFSVLGLLGFSFGSVFWVLHLVFRLTVVVQAAQEWSLSSVPPLWYEPWREWAGVLFAVYSVLAYMGLAAYGGALLKTGGLPRWIGWTCVGAGLVAAPLGGLPLFIHVPLWLVGILVLSRRASAGAPI